MESGVDNRSSRSEGVGELAPSLAVGFPKQPGQNLQYGDLVYLAAWYRREGVNICTHEVHARCMPKPNFVTGSEVAEVP